MTSREFVLRLAEHQAGLKQILRDSKNLWQIAQIPTSSNFLIYGAGLTCRSLLIVFIVTVDLDQQAQGYVITRRTMTTNPDLYRFWEYRPSDHSLDFVFGVAQLKAAIECARIGIQTRGAVEFWLKRTVNEVLRLKSADQFFAALGISGEDIQANRTYDGRREYGQTKVDESGPTGQAVSQTASRTTRPDERSPRWRLPSPRGREPRVRQRSW